MTDRTFTHRRGFLGKVAAGAVAIGLPWSRLAADEAPAPQSDHDRWLTGLTGKHRCLFDFPAHGEGWGLIHMLNYLNTYRQAYGTAAGEVNAIGTFYGAGPHAGVSQGASFPMAFNDAMWARYRFGEALKLTDPATRAPSTRNMFNKPVAGDPVLVGGGAAGASIENLQKAGAVFLLCNNALMFWVRQLAGAGLGTAAEIEKDLRANVLPGVVTVPAMVIAIEKVQTAGIAYNKQ
jgi:intracellular sulfur oxidation DsrE/DsrF family protein